jgi:hypothetical protein
VDLIDSATGALVGELADPNLATIRWAGVLGGRRASRGGRRAAGDRPEL